MMGSSGINKEYLRNKEYEKFNIYFKPASIGNKIYIFFSIFNKEKNNASLFYQILDEESNLSEPKVIDIVKYNYELPFTLYSEDGNELSIIYQRFSGNYEIGYTVLNKDNEKLSNFKLIDTSRYPFKDYSAVLSGKTLHAIYVKKENNADILNYFQDNTLKPTTIKLFENTNIESCLISTIYDQIFCFWIDDNKIYSSFSIDSENNFTNPPYEQLVNSSDVFKSIYISNGTEEKKDIICNEIYLIGDEILGYSIFYNLYLCIKNNHFLSYVKYYMTNIYSKVLLYEKEFNRISESNSNLINSNNHLTKKLNLLKKNLADIEDKRNSFKDKLSENINLYQKNLYDKEDKIKFLEKINQEKKEEILLLKEKFTRNITLYQKSSYDKDIKISLLEKINQEKEEEIQSLKENFSQDLALLQENLDHKEKEINSLENINIEKKKEIDILKEKLFQDEKVILDLIKKIKILNRNIKSLRSEI